jgi:replication factor A1
MAAVDNSPKSPEKKNIKRQKIVNEDDFEEKLFLPKTDSRTQSRVPPVLEYDSTKGYLETFRISDIVPLPDYERVSFVAIIKHPGEIKQTRDGKDFRFITIYDDSGISITLALWGDDATNFNLNVGNVVEIENAAVRTYMDKRQLSSVDETVVFHNSSSKRGKMLLKWLKNNKNTSLRQLYSNNTKPVSIDEVRKNANDQKGSKVFALVKGRMELPKESISYLSCSEPGCNKKIQKYEEENAWWCTTCQKNIKTPCHRYCLHAKVVSSSGITYMAIFDDVGNEMFGKTAKELLMLKVCFYFFQHPS